MQNNPSSWEALTFTSGAYNTNYNDLDEKHVAFNSFASDNQLATWFVDQHTSSYLAPLMEEDVSQTNKWMDLENID